MKKILERLIYLYETTSDPKTREALKWAIEKAKQEYESENN